VNNIPKWNPKAPKENESVDPYK